MTSHLEQLREYIQRKEFNAAIKYLEREERNFRDLLSGDNTILFALAAVKFENNLILDRISPLLFSLWVMEVHNFLSYLQWVPQEVMDDIVELPTLSPLFNLLLQYGMKVDTKKDGDTALHVAVAERNMCISNLLIGKGVDVNAENDNGVK